MSVQNFNFLELDSTAFCKGVKKGKLSFVNVFLKVITQPAEFLKQNKLVIQRAIYICLEDPETINSMVPILDKIVNFTKIDLNFENEERIPPL